MHPHGNLAVSILQVKIARICDCVESTCNNQAKIAVYSPLQKTPGQCNCVESTGDSPVGNVTM